MGKGQTAMEYLIILAVIIVIALVVLSLMGTFEKDKGKTKDEIATEMCEELGYGYLTYEWENKVLCVELYGSGIANITHTYNVDWAALESLYDQENETNPTELD